MTLRSWMALEGGEWVAAFQDARPCVCGARGEDVTPQQQRIDTMSLQSKLVLGGLFVALAVVPTAHAQRLSVFTFQCVGRPGAPTSTLRASLQFERSTIVDGRVVLDRRATKEVMMDCTPSRHNGFSRSLVPDILDTDGRLVAIHGTIQTHAPGGIVVTHTFDAGNNFAQGLFMAMPERDPAQAGQVSFTISVPNPSFE